MFNRAKKISFLLLLLSLVAGCNAEKDGSETTQDNKPLTFNGEGEIWQIENYQIEITPNSFVAGNGELSMKNVNEYFSNLLSFEVHAEINEGDEVIHKFKILGIKDNIAFKEIGKIKGEPYIDKRGQPITYRDFNNLYVIIEWEDSQGNRKKEKINLDS